MAEKYDKAAAFYVVYIKEAHPEDGWQMAANTKQGVIFNQPKIFDERVKVASACQKALKFKRIPMLIDDMDNTTDKKYHGWPDRLYVVGKDGKLAYCGGKGPFGFKPEHVERWLKENVKTGEKK